MENPLVIGWGIYREYEWIVHTVNICGHGIISGLTMTNYRTISRTLCDINIYTYLHTHAYVDP